MSEGSPGRRRSVQAGLNVVASWWRTARNGAVLGVTRSQARQLKAQVKRTVADSVIPVVTSRMAS